MASLTLLWLNPYGAILVKRGDRRLRLGKLEGEVRKKCLIDKSQSLFSQMFGTAQNHEIIRKADKPEVGLRQSKVKLVQDDISQQGRNNAPLRRALVNSLEAAVLKNTGCEKLAHNVEDVTIGDPLGNQIKNQLVRDVVEAGRNIGVHDPSETLITELDDSLDGLMLIATRPEAKGKVRERGFKDRLKQRFNHRLSHPVSDGGNAQRTLLPFPFGDVNTEQGLRRVTPPLFEVSHQSEQILLKVSLKHLDGDAINARRTSIAFDGNKGLAHPSHINTTGQGMNFGKQSETP